MVRENIVTPSNFIYPLFIHDEDFITEIASMPGCARHSLDSMLSEVGESMALGVKAFVLFPKVADELKTNLGVEAYNPEGIVPRAVRMIKEAYPDSVVCTDVALDPYSDQGHDGVVEDGKILNDVTINQLCKQAVCQAKAGADIVAPSDMMVRCWNRQALVFQAVNVYLTESFLFAPTGRSCHGDSRCLGLGGIY
jgi:porphobilinogen synthase